MSVQHIGDFNGIYFLEGAGGIVGVCDRAHRKDVVDFAEDGLVDLAQPTRPVATVIVGGALPGGPGTGPHHDYMAHGGFGRDLRYEALERQTPGVLAVRLTIGLPGRALYRLRFTAAQRDDDTFHLDNGISVTVSTSLPWAYQDGVLQVRTADSPGEIDLVVQSKPPPSRVRDVTIVACAGHERVAVMTRSRCGTGFVPCFVLAEAQWREHVAAPGEILVGPGAPDFDVLPADAPTLTAPDTSAAYGPGLALAVAHGARLMLSGQDEVLRLSGEQPMQWRLDDVLAVPLADFGDGREFVVAESTAADLLVCQAVGYASMQHCRIAFVAPVPDHTPDDMTALARAVAAVVPPRLREPDADVVAVFTRDLPLHLTPLPDGRRWMDRYLVAHLPGQIASTLLSSPVEPAPRQPFGVIFDALHAFTATEGRVYQERLAGGLSYPLLLSHRDARLPVLREVLQRFDVDLLVIIAHGEDDHFEDADNDRVTDGLIRTWPLRGRPVVFNNSCSSWTGTGSAFLAAGARAVIGTLWPVSNDVAVRIGSSVGERSHDEDVLTLLHRGVRSVAELDAAAYVYVGLPGTRLLARASLDEEETLAVLTEVMSAVFDRLTELAQQGNVDVARALHRAAVPALRERFGALATPGTPPAHLPRPYTMATVLDIDHLLATSGLLFLFEILPSITPRQMPAVLDDIRESLDTTYRELIQWDERQRAHLGQDFSSSEMERILRAAPFAALLALPGAKAFAHFGRADEARHWTDVAVQLIGPPDDETVRRHLREGIGEERIRMFTQDGTDGHRVTIDMLANATDKANLALRFGEARQILDETAEAIAYFEVAVSLAEAGSGVAKEADARLRALGRGEHDDLGARINRFEQAYRGGNPHDRRAAAADMLRRAADTGSPLPAAVVRHAMRPGPGWEHVPQPARVIERLSLLGAAITYFASRGDRGRVAVVRAESLGHLGDFEAAAMFPLSELAAWHHRNGDHRTAVEVALDLGTRLGNAQSADSAIRMLEFAAKVSRMALEEVPDPAMVAKFFTVSEMIGSLLSGHVDVRAALGEQVSDEFTTTESFWRQIAGQRRLRLALRGYRAYRSWPGGRQLAEWELLSHALHPRNIDAVRDLAAAGDLRREAHVRIDTDFTVTMTTATYRDAHT